MLNRLYRYGSDLRNLSFANPDFVPALSVDGIGSIVHETSQERLDVEEGMKRLHSLDELPESVPSDEKP